MSKKKITMDKESMNFLVQEVYNDIVKTKEIATDLLNQYTKNVKENEDIALVGKVNNDLLKIIDNTIDKKLKLIELQNKALGSAKDGKEIKTDINDETKEYLRNLIHNKNN